MLARLCRSHNSWPPLVFSLILLFTVLPCITHSDAGFEDVRIRYDLKDMSGRYGDPPGKYWHESIFHPHYDGRFTNKPLNYEDQKTNLSLLIQSYLFSMADIGAETWIIHGTLLGWWWNRKSLPWDSDIDVQMTASTVGFLAHFYNMTIHTFERRHYMLEINPKYTDGSPEDHLNVIDGRWIDVQTGLFIDITAVRPQPGSQGLIMESKDRHSEQTSDLFPLRESLFEGMSVKVPYNYAKLLSEEYGKRALTKLEHAGHRFNTTSMEWELGAAPSAPACTGDWRQCLKEGKRVGQ